MNRAWWLDDSSCLLVILAAIFFPGCNQPSMPTASVQQSKAEEPAPSQRTQPTQPARLPKQGTPKEEIPNRPTRPPQKTISIEPICLTGHEGAIYSVAVSPDGQTLASGGGPNEKVGDLRLWDLKTRKQLTLLEGHNGLVFSVAFDPAGKLLASAGTDKTIRLWDVVTGKEKAKIPWRGWVMELAFSPDGKTLAWCGGDAFPFENGGVVMWEVVTSREKLVISHGDHCKRLAFGPGGKTLVTAALVKRGDSDVKLWDVESGKEVAALTSKETVVSVAFSPDGAALAMGTSDTNKEELVSIGIVNLLDLATKQIRATLRGHRVQVKAVAFSPNGKLLATAGALDDSGEVKVWDAHTSKELARFRHGEIACNMQTLAFSPDGKTLACAGQEGIVKLWDLSALVLP